MWKVALITAAVLPTAMAFAQIPSVQHVPYPVLSGSLSNDADVRRTVFRHVAAVGDASSVQVRFGRTTLPDGCVLRLTSVLDGAVQHLRGDTLVQWNFMSAWFNGPMVLVEVLAEPGTTGAHVTIGALRVIPEVGRERTICGDSDDRELSDDPRTCRVMPHGGTAWMFEPITACMLTAGHVMDIDGQEIVEFNVPLSDANGNLQHLGPEDQYPIDPNSIQYRTGNNGNDWAVFGALLNSESNLAPNSVQNAWYDLAPWAPPADNRQITITGFGKVDDPVSPTWDRVQKTHTGWYAWMEDNELGYWVDTSQWNSGSAVQDQSNGTVIGIHTNGGCNSPEEFNHGTAIHNEDLQAALSNPLGACFPAVLRLIVEPGPWTLPPWWPVGELFFHVLEAYELPAIDSIRLRVTIDGILHDLPAWPVRSGMYGATLPPLSCGQDVSFYLYAESVSGVAVVDPPGAPDDQYLLQVGDPVHDLLLDERFAGGAGGWSVGGLWTLTETCTPTTGCGDGVAAYFGRPSSCTFDNGQVATGTLAAPVIPADSNPGTLVLSYCSSLMTEQFSAVDTARVLVNEIVVDEVTDSTDWETRVVNLDQFSGQPLLIQFVFDSVDDLYNEYRGWHVDNVQVIRLSVDCRPPPPCAADFDNDGQVAIDDLLQLIAAWGGSDGVEDLNGDGEVGIDDLLMLLEAWGFCGRG